MKDNLNLQKPIDEKSKNYLIRRKLIPEEMVDNLRATAARRVIRRDIRRRVWRIVRIPVFLGVIVFVFAIGLWGFRAFLNETDWPIFSKVMNDEDRLIETQLSGLIVEPLGYEDRYFYWRIRE